jgi:predicted DNA-binding transcriptional regulator AlpA
MDQTQVFLNSRQVRERYGNASEMFIWRRQTEPNSTFPKPLIISSRKFWRLADLLAWEHSLETEDAA